MTEELYKKLANISPLLVEPRNLPQIMKVIEEEKSRSLGNGMWAGGIVVWSVLGLLKLLS